MVQSQMSMSRLQSVVSKLSAVAVSLSLYLYSAMPAFAQEKWEKERCYTDNVVDGVTVAKNVATIRGIECMVSNILAVATTIIGLAAFIMVIVGAFLYLTSGGNSKGVEAGKQSMTYAVIGIILALLSYWILILISDFTGVETFLEFTLSSGF
jgi:amino acid transporter